VIPQLGQFLVLASLFFATLGCVTGFVAGLRGGERAWKVTRNAALGFASSMIAANLLMVYALLSHDFSVAYVAEVGSRSTPVYFTIVSLWASLNGSILFWGGVLGVYTAAMVLNIGDKHREYMPWTLHVLMAISIFFALMVATIADPFEIVSPVPADGPGPNPLLQNHWLMAIHPPMLYLGYVGMSVPFSMICASLLAGRLEAGWMEPLRRWALIPWTFLGIGIILGGWWSYAVLGWGGSWAWDPVENASFHPWLTGTAFLHSAMVLQRRGRLRDWTLLLGMATFLLTLVGTFMTRSGVFNSVHSFTQSDIGVYFLWFIGIVLTYSIVLLAARTHALDEAAKATDQRLGARANSGGALLSREFAIVLQNGLFTVFTLVVLLGTLYPLLMEYYDGTRASVGEPWFDRKVLPLGLALTFMMGVGPSLPWGRLAADELPKRLGYPTMTAAAICVIAAGTGVLKPYTLFALFVCGFALHCNLGEFVQPVRARMRSHQEGVATATIKVFLRGRRRFGGHITHLGIILCVFSLAMTKGYRTERDLTMAKGDTAEFAGYTLTFEGARLDKEPHREALVASYRVHRDASDLGLYEPRMNFYPTRREPIFSPAVYSTLSEDLYLSIIEVPTDGSSSVIRVIKQPFQVWMWFTAPMIGLGTLVSLWPARRRRRVRAGRVNLWILIGGLAVSLPLIGLLATGFGKDPNAIPSVLENREAPGFRLIDIDGREHSLPSLSGKPVVLNFWSTWCGPCKMEHPALQQAARQNPGVTFLGIIYSDDTEKVRRYLKKAGSSYPTLVDEGNRTAIDYGVTGVPETFFIDAQGVIRRKVSAPLSPPYLAQFLSEIR